MGSAGGDTFDVDGGTGEMYRGVTGGFGLYAFARQRVRFWVAELPRAAAVVATALVG